MTEATDLFAIRRLGDCPFDSPLDIAQFADDRDGVLVDPTIAGCCDCERRPPALECAGPRRRIHFEPARTRAAIVTCGGLCPGLNDVIRAITMVLWHRYGVRAILGLRYGYEGITESAGLPPVNLTPDLVEDIHQKGGTLLGSSRGPQDPAAMTDFLVARGVNILFTIGGDGTQKGALRIVHEIKARNLDIAVVGVPKTIDNDISFTERTFGFETAVALSRVPIASAHMEAKGARNGVGLVKLMGRDSGFVAAYATLASSDVNLVLVPEVPFRMDAVLTFLERRLQRKEHAVIVVAEGAGQDMVAADGVDKSGNRALGDIGVHLKDAITRHFHAIARPVSVKYIDPSYTIRSAPATADDSVFCFQLGRDAVHAAMAGRTGMIVGLWAGRFVHVPMERAVAARKRIDPTGALWQSVLDNTGQPAVLS